VSAAHDTPVFRALAACLAALDPLDEAERSQVVGALDVLTAGWRTTRTAEWSKRDAERWARDSQDGWPVGGEP
jgi:hypothetical protein